MRRSALPALAIAFVLAQACGTPPPPAAATVQSVALQTSDLPKGMVLCGLSGDVDTFLKGAPANNQYASQLQSDWNALKAQGAQQGYVRVFARSQADCKSAFTSSTSTSVPLVANMVVRFKTPATAAKAYTQADVGAAPIAQLPGAQQGGGTGLGKNSLSFGDNEGSQSIYFAYWQHARFLALLLAVDVGVNQSRQAAIHVDSRIH
jgi:hypothetical protein